MISAKTYLVARRKKSCIDSIVKGYTVPLVLLAEVTTEKGKQLEIIDGMQRMNALMSFIDQEYDVSGSYFCNLT